MQDTTAEMLRAVVLWAQDTYPYLTACKLEVHFHGQPEPVSMPLFPVREGSTPAHVADDCIEEKKGRVSQCVLDIFTVLREAKRPLTTYGILEAMATHKPVMEWDQRTVSGYLSKLIKDGALLNPPGAKPGGYRLPSE
jgi:hypothetical protein